MITQTLHQSIESVVADLNLPQVKLSLDHPTNSSHGDYATNIAMVIFPKLDADQKKSYPNPLVLTHTIAN